MSKATSLILLYDYDLGDMDWREAGLPIFMARVNVSTEEVEKYAEDIIKLSGRNDAKFLQYMPDTEESLKEIHQVFHDFAEQYHCYIEYQIHELNLSIGKKSKPTKSLLAVFYGEPVFPCVQGLPDIAKEMPLGVMEFKGNINNVNLNAILDSLRKAGTEARHWYIFPFTEENFRYFIDKAKSFTENVNACIRCQKINGSSISSCRNCELFYMASYAQQLIEDGFSELYVDSEELEVNDEEEEE